MRSSLAAGRRGLLALGTAGVLAGAVGGRSLLPATAASRATVVTVAPAAGASPGAVPPGAAGSVTVDGAAVQMRYGTVQVRVSATRAGGSTTITAVTALQLPSGRSQRYSDYAGPVLAQEAVSAGTAQIQTVSGATYTSTAYRTSLQAALDALAAA